ncbi:50S ribosomal protein L11 methyltransferase [Sphingobacterium alkalisoli]|uniref:Ribosomal protein L11 methyltransferase n=1 Tax=Sphingobacterium alkalisoli TaxID=1874115 RepID=A0A4U0H0P2_9SPHI|nr:50S ribosomal protein L11 methyltransferase [Sphingobacterium alkalisoli]TJY63772.1 50S ribosomal protein L11 methyltransferase [Sphingobacterium alkalisoli]GGH24969.1 ribosomal protein L11 methyltransferase [Sphingobacterium alkalisoli]
MKYASVVFNSSDIEDWQRDLFIAELGDIGFDTFEDVENGFIAYIPSANLDVQALETLVLTQAVGFHIAYEIIELAEQNWNILWESNFNPIVVDDQCYVRATFHEPHPEYAYEIIIDPKMSFGTGHHQTTSMMLSFILENNFADKRVLDMGCGTGILAILASKKGAKSIMAVDFDSICVDSVEENKKLNKITNITSHLGSKEVIENRVFEIILANINRNILLDQLEVYARALTESGELYMSGFYYEEDLMAIREKCESLNLFFRESKKLDTWCSVKFIKK